MARRKKAPQGRLAFEYEVEKDDGSVTSYGGLPLIIDMLRSRGMERSIRTHVNVRERACEFDEVALVEALALLFAAGGDCIDDMRMLAADGGLCRLLERQMPSPETVRQFLYAFHEDGLIEQARSQLGPGQAAYIPAESKPLEGLGRVLADFVQAAAKPQEPQSATLDADATIVESHKQEAKAHYDDGRGFQPMLAVWSELDLIVADQFRDGNVPSSMGVLDFVQRAFAVIPDYVKLRRFRADSAFYVWELMKWLFRERIGFTISARMSEELKEACRRVPEEKWQLIEERVHEDVYIAEVSHIPADWPDDIPTVRFIGIRFEPKQKELFGARERRYLAIATDRTAPAAELVRWHWEKAGTIEHTHDVMKNELAAGVLPCGRFGANAAWWRINALTYNVLSALRGFALPPHLKKARPKRLRFEIFTVPAVIAFHARQLWARLKERGAQATDILLGRRRCWVASPAI